MPCLGDIVDDHEREVDALLGYLAGAPTYSLMADTGRRRRPWVLNEKRLVEPTGLQDLHTRFTSVPTSPSELVAWVDGLRAAIGGESHRVVELMDQGPLGPLQRGLLG